MIINWMEIYLKRLCASYRSIINLSIAAICSGFGNSLEAVSILASIQSIFLLLGFYYSLKPCHTFINDNSQDSLLYKSIGNSDILTRPVISMKLLRSGFITVTILSLSMVFGFSTAFGYPHTTICKFNLVNILIFFSLIICRAHYCFLAITLPCWLSSFSWTMECFGYDYISILGDSQNEQ